MILTASRLVLSLRWVPPAVAILGSSPIFLVGWTAVRILTFPLPRRFYRILEDWMNSNNQKMIGFYYETWSGVEFCYYGDEIPEDPENVLYLSNHQCSVDWLIPELLCVKQGGYGGRARYILKDTLRYIPLYGWYLGLHGGIYIKRRKNKDQNTLIKGLRRFVDEDIPVWLVIFPEGTRYGSTRVKNSKEYARKKGLQELDHVLIPKTTGFELALEHIGDHFNAVYDVTIYYEGMKKNSRRCGRAPPPDAFSIFCGVTSKVHIHVRRVPMKDIPKDLEDRRKWLHEAYQQKDKLMKHFLLHDNCDSTRVMHPLYLSQSLVPTFVITAFTVISFSARVGRIAWLSAFTFFTAVTFISTLVTEG